jgi:hypothetical protein
MSSVFVEERLHCDVISVCGGKDFIVMSSVFVEERLHCDVISVCGENTSL